jgi:rare lipoprotein A
MRLPVNLHLPLIAVVLLGSGMAVSHVSAKTLEPLATSGPAADYPVTIGAPYTIDGVTYTPTDALNSDNVGYAVAGSDGGEAISIAHKTLPVPSYAEVTSLDSGKTILVRVERRGPMTNDRLVELSPGAAMQLGLTGTDKAPIRIRRVNPPEVERAMLRTGSRAPARMDTPQSLLTVLKRKLDPALVPPPVAASTPVSAATPAPVVATPEPVNKPVRKPRGRRPAAPPSVSVTPPTPPAADPAPYQPAMTMPEGVELVSIPVVQAIPGQTAADANSGAVVQPITNDSGAVVQPLPSTTDSKRRTSARFTRGSLYVQAGAFGEKANAYAAAAKLGAAIRPSGNLSVVVLGPFSSRREAEAALAKARQAGYRDARIQSAR